MIESEIFFTVIVLRVLGLYSLLDYYDHRILSLSHSNLYTVIFGVLFHATVPVQLYFLSIKFNSHFSVHLNKA